MKKFCQPLLAFLFLLCAAAAGAQTLSLDNLSKFGLRNTGPIMNGPTVNGYYYFYRLDKVNKKESNFMLKIVDQNLNEVATEIIKDITTINLLEGEYNGTALMLKFYDSKGQKYIYRTYDSKAKEISKNEVKIQDAIELRALALRLASEDPGDQTLYAVDGHGFLDYKFKKDKKYGYEINYFSDTKGVKGWKYISDPKSKFLEWVSFANANDKCVVNIIQKKKGVMSGDFNLFVQMLDINTGKKMYEVSLDDPDNAMYPMNVEFDEATGNLIVFGLYFKPKDDPIKDKSLGLCSYFLDPTGKIVSKKLNSWATEVSKFLPVDAKGRIEDVGFLQFHKIVKSKDGHYIACAESYRRKVSGLGMLSGGGRNGVSMIGLAIEDFYMFKFTNDFTLEKVEIIDKHKSFINLPKGAEYMGPTLMAAYVKQIGGFDYSFLTTNEDKSVISFGFFDEREDNEKSKKTRNKNDFGAVSYHDGIFTVDRIALETDASKVWVQKAKPGYVLVQEYFKKLKKLDIHFEKINF